MDRRKAIKKSRVHRALATRRLYRFEEVVPLPPRLRVARRMRYLQALSARVWRECAQPRYRLPAVVAGRGTQHAGRWVSYCQGRRRIVLARHERNVLVLLHELRHALGAMGHSRRFVRGYFALLQRFAGVDPVYLELHAHQFKIRV